MPFASGDSRLDPDSEVFSLSACCNLALQSSVRCTVFWEGRGSFIAKFDAFLAGVIGIAQVLAGL